MKLKCCQDDTNIDYCFWFAFADMIKTTQRIHVADDSVLLNRLDDFKSGQEWSIAALWIAAELTGERRFKT